MSTMTSAKKRRFIVPDGFTGYGVHCVLCETGTMTGKKTVLSHVNGSWHSRNCFTFDIAERAKKARDLYNPRIEKLGLSRWRREVRALLYQYITSNNSVTSDAALGQADKLLARFETMEKLSLLELAVWKASLTNDVFFTSMDDLDAYWTLELGFSPVAYKNDRRVTSGITVIIQNVLPFLK